MIVQIYGKLIEKKETALLIEVSGLCYEVIVPLSVLQRVDSHLDEKGCLRLVTYQYLQMDPSRGMPMLIGFMNEIEREFFQQFIKVSGIGPRAAVRALNKPIAEITGAIESGDVSFLKSLPGIGAQRAKEIIAKLQGKIGRFGLIQDDLGQPQQSPSEELSVLEEEALSVLLQLQYKKSEAQQMIKKALERSGNIQTIEDLLNEIYKQKVKG